MDTLAWGHYQINVENDQFLNHLKELGVFAFGKVIDPGWTLLERSLTAACTFGNSAELGWTLLERSLG